MPSLDDPVRYLKGVGPKKAEILSGLGIRTAGDLLCHYPFRLDDFSRLVPIDVARPGDDVTVVGRVVASSFVGSQRGQALRVRITDGRGVMSMVWYNMPYMRRNFPTGREIIASGRVEWRRSGLEMAHPIWQPRPRVEGASRGPIIPVYHSTASLGSSAIGRIIRDALPVYAPLIRHRVPEELLSRNGHVSLSRAIFDIHDPPTPEAWHTARRALAFGEMLYLQIALLSMRQEAQDAQGPGAFRDFASPDRFVDSLPFVLTTAQQMAISDIRSDLSSGRVMNRLLQGDVGSGKTVVAVYALLAAAANGFQGALLAPTEILSEQHFATIKEMCRDLVSVGLLTGSTKPAERETLLSDLKAGRVNVLVGTHAMLERDISWHNLGVVVTDEQHRFGVRQRLALSGRRGVSPHVLVMSATPIPRSLALTLYGDLDVSIIDSMPVGRVPVKTVVVDGRGRREAYRKVREEVLAGRQAYVVCPLIREGASGRKAAGPVAAELADSYLKGLSIGLIHGDLPRRELLSVMAAFLRRDVNVLVSTTVIEVGVDVPNASVMVVEDADSFGLATLHQLRGRIGRGAHQSYCYLVASAGTEAGRERVRAMESLSDGFAVAEADLEQRGPGQFFGMAQHGLSDLKLSHLQLTLGIVSAARDEARRVIAATKGEDPDPALTGLAEAVRDRFGDLFAAGRSR